MPNRIIKESICSNEQIDQLSPFEEIFFYRLIVNADDFGRMDGRPSILRARLFPLKAIRDDQIEKALHTLTSVELVHRYYVHGKPFVRLLGWERNQQIRAKKSRYPSPEDADGSDPIPADAGACYHMISNDIKCSRNPIQSESESNPNPEAETRPREAAAAPELSLEAYAAANLTVLSPRNMEELVSFREPLSEELIRHAIDEACANGKRTWAYVRSILARYVRSGYRTVGDAEAEKAERAKLQKHTLPSGAPNPAMQYEQRSLTDDDFSGVLLDFGGGQ